MYHPVVWCPEHGWERTTYRLTEINVELEKMLRVLDVYMKELVDGSLSFDSPFVREG